MDGGFFSSPEKKTGVQHATAEFQLQLWPPAMRPLRVAPPMVSTSWAPGAASWQQPFSLSDAGRTRRHKCFVQFTQATEVRGTPR